MDIPKYAEAIVQNVERDGLYRYDPNDIDAMIFRHKGKVYNNLPRKILRTMDILAPVVLRKCLLIPKTISPATYYHLGMAYLAREQYHIEISAKNSAAEMINGAISDYYKPDTGLWISSTGYNLMPPECLIEKEGPLTLPMHFLARLNILLLDAWKVMHEEQYLKIAAHSAESTMHYHNLIDRGDGCMAISYFYNSMDVINNVNAEFLEWVAKIPQEYRSQELTDLCHGILKLLLREQNEDGSFYYHEKEFMAFLKADPMIDNFHTAYTLKNLIGVCDTEFAKGQEREDLLNCCMKGMDYYLSNMFNETTGVARQTMSLAYHAADAVTYGEALTAFCAFLRSPSVPQHQKKRVAKLAPKAMEQMLALINQKNGSAPTQILFGKKICMNSIRWGNGPALQAIFEYLGSEKDGLLNI